MSFEAKSGIVYYPDQGKAPFANLARQLGMVAGSTLIDGELQLATAHAVAYNPGTVEVIMEGHGVAGNAILPADDMEALVPLLHDDLVDAAFRHLQELGLAKDPVHAFDWRRVDIIVPGGGNTQGFAAAVAHLVPRLEGRPHVTPHVWTFGERPDQPGTFWEYAGMLGPLLDPSHPLGPVQLVGRVSDHRVRTTKATGSPVVIEEVTVIGQEKGVMSTQGPRYLRTTSTRERLDEKVEVKMPPPDDFGPVDKLALRQFEADDLKAAAWKGEPEEYAPQYIAYSRWAYQQDRATDTAATLDPLNNKQWRDRLN